MLYLCILIFFVFFAGVAMTIAEGLWNNAITLLSILICGPLAIAAGYPVGLLIQDKMEKPVEQTWYFVFGGVWLVFFFSIMVLRLLADRVASRTRMKFVPPLELAAGPVVGLMVAVMFTSFLTFTLYTIPIAAGEWKIAEASGWQQTTMQSGSGPFNAVLKAMAGEEVATYHLP
jgi:TRAP-type C4-dicarboxylate transport system permease small subunit